MCTLNVPVSILLNVYVQRERLLKAADVAVGSASSKVASFSRHLVMGKMESLLLEWMDRFTKQGVPLPCT